MQIYGIPILKLKSLSILNTADSGLSEIKSIIQQFIDADKYLSKSPSQAINLFCASVVSLKNYYFLKIDSIDIFNVSCMGKPKASGITAISPGSSCVLTNIHISNIHSLSETGNAILIQGKSSNATLSWIYVENVLNDNGSVLEIADLSYLEITGLSAYNLTSVYNSPIAIKQFTQAVIKNIELISLTSKWQSGGCLSVYFNALPYTSFFIKNALINGCSSPNSEGGCLYFYSRSPTVKVLIIMQSLSLLNCLALDGAAVYFTRRLALLPGSFIGDLVITNSTATAGAIISDSHAHGLLIFQNIRMFNNTGINAGIRGEYLDSLSSTLNTNCATLRSVEISHSYSYETVMVFRSTNSLLQVLIEDIIINDILSDNSEYAEAFLVEGIQLCIYHLSATNMSQVFNIRLSSYLEIYESTFVYIYGGFVIITDDASFKCNNCEVSYITNMLLKSNSIGNITLEQSKFYNNTDESLDDDFFSISLGNSYAFISNCAFANNVSKYKSVFFFWYANIMIQTCTFSNNSAAQSESSGIYTVKATISINESSFDNQSSNLYGGFLLLMSSTASIYNSNFSQGYAANGGAIYANHATLSIQSSVFINNNAGYAGGSINGLNAYISMTGTQFISGSSLFGDAISMYLYGLEMSYCLFLRFENTSSLSSSMIYITFNYYFTMDNSISTSTAGNGLGFYLANIFEIYISDSVFQNIASSSYGALTCTSNNFINGGILILNNTSFIENYSLGSGAGLYVENMYVTMINCTIQGNLAEVNGGGLYLVTPNCILCEMSITANTIITDNACNINGGGVFWSSFKPFIDDSVIIQNNTASYGSDLAGPASSLKSSSSRELSDFADYVIFAAAPGQTYLKNMTICIYDTYNNVIVTDNTSVITIQPITDYPELSLKGQTTFTAVKGVYSLIGFIPGGPPGSVQRFNVSTNAISIRPKNDNGAYISSATIEIFLRNCTYGEQVGTLACTICQEETFLIEPSGTCSPCPAGGLCPGGNQLLPSPGHWRSSNLSTIIYSCPISEACLGNLTVNDTEGSCSEGYYGIMCDCCNGGYQKISDDTCSVCPSLSTNISISLLIVLILLILGIVLIKESIKSAYSTKALYSVYIKILTNYTQLMFLTAQFEFSWPSYMLKLLNIQKIIASSVDSIVSLECYVASESSGDPVNSYYYKLIFMSMLPIFILIVSFIGWFSISVSKETYRYLKREIFLTIIIGFFLVYPNICLVNFSHFYCQNIDKLRSFLKANYAVECWSNRYMQYYFMVVIPSIVVWNIGLPALILAIMIKRRKCLRQDNNRVIFGFIFNGYRRERFYWEFIIMYRKILMISIVVFFNSFSLTVQALSIFLVLNFSTFLHYRLRPYFNDILNSM